MNLCNHLNDGYTQKGYIQNSDRKLYKAMRFTYRPGLIEERAEIWGNEYRERPLKQSYQMTAVQLEKKILKWDVVDQDGKPVTITTRNILQLPSELFLVLQDVVFGFRPSDVDPQWEEETKKAEQALNLESAITGQDIGQTRDSSSAKNSEPG